MGRISKMRLGSGEGTTRRQCSPSCLNVQPFSAATASACCLSYMGPTNLVGSANAGSAGSTSTMVSTVAKGHLGRQDVAQLLLDQVADHPLGLGAEDVEGVGLDLVVGGRLQRQQADLRAVAVRDHQFVLAGEGRERAGRDAHVLALHLDRHRLAPLEQGVAPQADDDRAWQPSSVTQRGDHDRLDGVHAVLGLVPDDGSSDSKTSSVTSMPSRPYCSIDLLAHLGVAVVEGGQAVQELDVGVAGLREHGSSPGRA